MRHGAPMVLAAGLILAARSLLAAPADDLDALLDDAWQWRLEAYPVFASRLGDRRFNTEWTDLSVEAHEHTLLS